MWSNLEAFVLTAESQSFRLASERLGVTAAAVSKAVSRLEATLGVTLLHRTSRRVSLTPEGAVFLAHGRAALDQLQAGRDRLEGARAAPEGRLRLSLSPSLGPLLVPPLAALAERHPRLHLSLSFSDRHVRLFEDDIDLAVRIGESEDSSLLSRSLRTCRFICVAAPAYLGSAPPLHRPADLAQHRCILFTGPGGAPLPWWLCARPGGHTDLLSLTPAPALELDSGPLVVLAATAGAGICQALDFMVRDDLLAGRLIEVLPQHSAPGPTIRALYRPTSRENPAIIACLDLLQANISP